MNDVLARVTIEGWVAIALSLLVFALYADHLWHSALYYRRHRGAANLRDLMLALLLAAGMLGIVTGNIARYVPEAADAARFVRWISVGMLFVGGITTFVTWHRERE